MPRPLLIFVGDDVRSPVSSGRFQLKPLVSSLFLLESRTVASIFTCAEEDNRCVVPKISLIGFFFTCEASWPTCVVLPATCADAFAHVNRKASHVRRLGSDVLVPFSHVRKKTGDLLAKTTDLLSFPSHVRINVSHVRHSSAHVGRNGTRVRRSYAPVKWPRPNGTTSANQS